MADFTHSIPGFLLAIGGYALIPVASRRLSGSTRRRMIVALLVLPSLVVVLGIVIAFIE